MSRVEFLQEQMGSASSLWKQYLGRSKAIDRESKKVDFFCFYEGKDDCKFYNIKLLEMDKQVTHFICYSKINVINFRKFMKKRYGKLKKIIYFIDKDFDEIIDNKKYNTLKNKNNLYITPCYSVENIFTDKKVFENILINEYNYPLNSENYKELQNKFLILKNEFHEYIKNINFWYATYKYFYNKKDIRHEINFSKFPLGKYIDLDINENKILVKKIESNSLLENLKLEIESLPDNFDEEMENIKKLFSNFDYEFRGKLELFFLTSFLDKINKNKKYNNFKYASSNIMSNIVQYTDKPDCLYNFIKKIS